MAFQLDFDKPNSKTKAQIKDDKATNKLLYGAGAIGWTEELYKKILSAYKEGRLSITSDYCKGDINLLLAENKKEADLTDDERIMLFAFAHPIAVYSLNKEQINRATTVVSYEWHKLTDFRHIDDVKQYYPDTYKRWAEKGMIPNVQPARPDQFLETESPDAFLNKLRKEVPQDSELRQPHENWYEEYKNGAVYNELFGD